jgi:hypothetical protein
MNGARFGALSSIEQTVTREMKAIWEEAFSRAFDDDINKYFYLFCGFLWPQFGNLIVTLCIKLIFVFILTLILVTAEPLNGNKHLNRNRS